MVDKYLTCTRTGCNGVMERLGGDARGKFIKFKCRKCGYVYEMERLNVDAGVHSFNLNSPNDPLRGQFR